MAAPATAKPLLAEDIGVAAFPDVPYESPLRALCKPAFAPLDTQMFVSGTEEPSADGDGKNHIVFGRIDFKSKRTEVLEDGRPAIWTTPVPGQVRDVAWLTADHAVGALGDQLGIIHFKHDGAHSSSSEIALLPRVHGDTIRELAVNPTRPHLILSASFDGTCILSDLLQVCGL